jgi:hypothetical protein
MTRRKSPFFGATSPFKYSKTMGLKRSFFKFKSWILILGLSHLLGGCFLIKKNQKQTKESKKEATTLIKEKEVVLPLSENQMAIFLNLLEKKGVKNSFKLENAQSQIKAHIQNETLHLFFKNQRAKNNFY